MFFDHHYILKNLAGESILVYQNESEVNYSKVISLNEIGTLIVQDLMEDCSFEEIVNHILDVYEIDKETARSDCENFINKLKTLGVVDD